MGCATYTDSTTSATLTLSEELWMLVGPSAANSYTEVTKVAKSTNSSGAGSYDDGSTLAYAFRYGTGSDSSLIGKTRLAYNPLPPGAGGQWYDNGVRFNLSSGTSTTEGNLTSFTSADWTNGFVQEHNLPPGLISIRAFQLVPLYSQEDGYVRMYFEGEDGAGSVRFYSIDAFDGYEGTDYNFSISHSLCGYPTSFQPDLSTSSGADCESRIEVDIDTTLAFNPGDSGLSMIRQSKIGYPVTTDWRWDPTTNAHLVMTGTSRALGLSLSSGGGATIACPDYLSSEDSLFYAVWNTTTEAWDVEIDLSGCAIALVPQAHGPVPTHVGDQRYKMYYEDTSTASDKCAKPLKMIYANGAETAPFDLVEFAEWDTASAVNVHFYWPDGTLLTADEESGLGDHMVLNLLDEDPAIQIMYLNLGGRDGPGCTDIPSTAGPSNGIGAAVLLNP